MSMNEDELARACADTMWANDNASRGLGMKIEEVRLVANQDKGTVEEKIAGLETEVADQRQKFEETFSAQFIVADDSAGETDPTADLDETWGAEGGFMDPERFVGLVYDSLK